MAELQRDTPLFDKVMVVKLQNGASPQETARQIPLTLRIINGTRPTANNSQSEKMVHIEVTDENDPYFLYILDVGEQDFHHLKRDQSLLVEFPVFPSKLIELIELCLGCCGSIATTVGTSSSSSPSGLGDAASYLSSFSANLDISSGVFSVIEANRFKQLTHISLQLRQGNDAAIKAYLASRLVFINTVAGKKSKELDGALAELEAERRQRLIVTTELTELRSLRETDVQTLRSQHVQELSQVKIDNVTTMEQERSRYELLVSTLRAQIEAIQNTMHGTREQMEQQITELSLDRSQLDFQVKELTRQMDTLQSDRSRMTEDTTKATTARRLLEEEKNTLGRDFARCEARLEALTQQLKDREETMSKTVALHRAGEEAREALEEKLQLFADNLSMTQSKLQNSGSEIDKGNAIIEQLHQENRHLREKIKSKGDIIKKQETFVNDLKQKMAEQERSIVEAKDNTHSQQLEMASLQRQFKETQERLVESNKVISSNQEVISYLNEEINKWQIGVRATSGVNMQGGTLGSASKLSDAYYPSSSPYPSSTLGGGGGGGSGGGGGGAALGLELYPYSSSLTKRYSRDNHTHSNYSHASYDVADPYGVNALDHQQYDIPIVSPDHTNAAGAGSGTSSDGHGDGNKDQNDMYLRGMRNLGLGDSFGNLEDLGLDLTVEKTTSLYGGMGEKTAEKHAYLYGGIEEKNVYKNRDARTNYLTDTGGIDLESLDYYKTTSGAAVNGGVRSINSGGRTTATSATSKGGRGGAVGVSAQGQGLVSTVTPPTTRARPSTINNSHTTTNNNNLSNSKSKNSYHVSPTKNNVFSPSHTRLLPDHAME